MEYLDFDAQHLDAVVRMTELEGWPSFAADPARALRVLTAPGTVAVVAVEGGEVVGFARVLTDGAISGYLADMAVVPAHRGQGVGRRLVEEALVEACTLLLDRHTTAAPIREPRAEVRQVRDRLADESADPPTLGELAAMTGLSKYQVLRRFQNAYGVPPHAWLQQRRDS